jgi:hypothetical protein
MFAIINTNATEITCYQYLGMTKIFGVQNVLPKTFSTVVCLAPQNNDFRTILVDQNKIIMVKQLTLHMK